MGVLLLFVDGIGVGVDDPAINPFAAVGARRLAPLRGRPPSDGAAFRPLDATLGVPGLPQSATGQTTLFTGVNASRYAGRHMTGVPGPTLRPLLERDTLFHRVVAAGLRPTFANGYTRTYLEARRPRLSATTRMVLASGVPLRRIDHGEDRASAMVHDYTGEWAAARGIDVPRRSAEEAARVLAGHLADHDLVLYEYFLTDLMAHRGTEEDRVEQARRVEALADACVDAVDLDRDVVVLVSDHGNLEDDRHRRHTLNPVPFLAWGRGADALAVAVDGMEAVTPALVDRLEK